MATVTVTQTHTLGMDEAKEKAQALMARMQQKLSRLIGETVWSEDSTRGVATGKMFTAEFIVGETEVSLTVELKGLGGKFLAPKVEADTKRIFARTFG
ncbi:MAG: hypothetical protein ABIK09_08470 [Pseudomonadota bacterium]